jgi:gamma-glutamyltranspeptidase/glutathione hydrolase
VIRRTLSLVAAAVALVTAGACKHDAAPPPPAPARGSAAGSAAAGPTVTGVGKTYLVVSESLEASAAGRDILAHGGNAVDAACATAFALAVTHPQAGNIAGGGFAIVHAGSADAALDFRETAPAAAKPDMYLDGSGAPTKDSLVGDRATGTPGSVAGLFALHAKYGALPWPQVVAPAIALARDGFVVEPSLAKSLTRDTELLAKFPASAALWLPGGKPIPVGTTLKLPELAATLQRIADQGPDGFYKGDTAKLIVDEMTRGGGLVTAADLAGYKAVWREPLRVDYRGYKMLAMPPPSSGGIVLALTANMLRRIDLGSLGFHSVQHLHEIVEVWRRAFAARNELLGDPAFVTGMPVDRLMSQTYADELAATIGPSATPSKQVSQLIEGTHTTNISVADAGGMAVAMTTTINTSFGNGVTVAGAGFVLNDEMDDFAAKPGSPNVYGLVQGSANKIEPGKRMLSSMSPTIVLDDHGAVFAVAGAGGGPRIITAVWQTLSNLIDFHLAIATAVAAPRIHHQHLPDKVFIERGSVSADEMEPLRALGYVLDESNPPPAFGGVTALARTPTGWAGTADPRRGGAALGDAP